MYIVTLSLTGVTEHELIAERDVNSRTLRVAGGQKIAVSCYFKSLLPSVQK